MALETATYINGLVITNPAGGDDLSQGDDHIRLLKSTIKATFPLITTPWNSTGVVGTASESSGVPTGALFEYGSNANGSYEKLAGRTLICRAAYTPSSLAITTAYGSVYRSAIQTITWPHAFSDYPSVCGGFRSSGGGILSICFTDSNLTTASYYITSPTSETLTVGATILGVGKWHNN